MKFNLALIQINVTDINLSENFYVDILGMEKDIERSANAGVPVIKSDMGIPIIFILSRRKLIGIMRGNPVQY